MEPGVKQVYKINLALPFAGETCMLVEGDRAPCGVGGGWGYGRQAEELQRYTKM